MEGAEVLDITFSDRFKRNVNVGEVKLAANAYGNGRGVYMAGLPYSPQNARLLYRAMFWAAHKEGEMYKAFSSNPEIECSYYPETENYTVVNNSSYPQETVLTDMNGKRKKINLAAGQIVWLL